MALRGEMKSGLLLALIVGVRGAAPAGDKKVRAIDWFTVKTRYDVSWTQSVDLKAAASPASFLICCSWLTTESLSRWSDANG